MENMETSRKPLKMIYTNDDGNFEETELAIKVEISALFGFPIQLITLLEGSYKQQWNTLKAERMSFQVCGFGYTTDFYNIWRAEEYDGNGGCDA